MTTGMWMWLALFGASLGFELFAIKTHRPTLSQAVWRAPTWFRVSLAGAFAVLLMHLFVGWP